MSELLGIPSAVPPVDSSSISSEPAVTSTLKTMPRCTAQSSSSQTLEFLDPLCEGFSTKLGFEFGLEFQGMSDMASPPVCSAR